MNMTAPSGKPRPFDWKGWLFKLCVDHNYFPRSPIEKALTLYKYRIYIDSTCAMFLGELLSNGGFYSVYEHACNMYPQYQDSLCIVDASTGMVL